MLDKSINSMLSAIEIYNKPNFSYREETFSILAINSWELLFKAILLKNVSYKCDFLFIKEPILKKNGQKSLRKRNKLNRVGNPITIGIFDAIKKLNERNIKISDTLNSSIEALVELRDNAIHFVNEREISKEIQELGFACIKNYMNFIKKFKVEIDLSKYNFYLMPLAYVDSKVYSKSIITEEVRKYLEFIKSKVDFQEGNDDFTVAISIDVKFNKSNSFDGIGIKYQPDGIPISLSEEEIKTRFPLDHKKITTRAKKRYSNFKQDKGFNEIMKKIKSDESLCYIRKLDPENPKSNKKPFYSSNIWQELDQFYSKTK